MERPDHEDMAKGDEAPPESEGTGGQGRIEEAVGGG